MPTISMESDIVNRKIINVSKKRQITIPIDFFKHLNISHEVECSLEGDAIIIRPFHIKSSEFSVEILKDLVSQGYSGDELVKQFEAQNKNIRRAVGHMLEEADEIITNQKSSVTFDDLFDSENDDV